MQIQFDTQATPSTTTTMNDVAPAAVQQPVEVPVATAQTPVVPAVPAPAGQPGHQDVLNSLKSMQKQLDLMKDTSFQIDFDKDIDRVIVKYVSNDTGEVVSQIPSKDFVNFEKEFVKTIGLLFDKKV